MYCANFRFQLALITEREKNLKTRKQNASSFKIKYSLNNQQICTIFQNPRDFDMGHTKSSMKKF